MEGAGYSDREFSPAGYSRSVGEKITDLIGLVERAGEGVDRVGDERGWRPVGGAGD